MSEVYQADAPEVRCRDCNEIKPRNLEHFALKQMRPSYFPPQCRKCGSRARRVAGIKQNKARIGKTRQWWADVFERGYKKCSVCARVLSTQCFREIGGAAYKRLASHCRECDAEREARYRNQRASTVRGSLSFVFGNIQKRSSDRGESPDFDLDYLEELWDKQGGRCYFTNVQLQLSNNRKTVRAGGGYKKNGKCVVSVDRLDPARGYFRDNVVLCTWAANNMKQDLTLEEFREWITLLHANFITK